MILYCHYSPYWNDCGVVSSLAVVLLLEKMRVTLLHVIIWTECN